MSAPAPAFRTTTDAFLDGAVRLVQPAGAAHRAGSDAVFLAACLRNAHGRALDMGAGCGAVGLLAAHANPALEVMMAENDPVQLACAQASVAANPALAGRVGVVPVDLVGPEAARTAAGLDRASFDHIVSNPPYRPAGRVRASPPVPTPTCMIPISSTGGCAPLPRWRAPAVP